MHIAAGADLPAIAEIERQSYDWPWTEEIFRRLMFGEMNCYGLIAMRERVTVGFVFFRKFPTRVHLVNLAVLQDCRRTGVGSALLAGILHKARRETHPKDHVTADLRECHLSGCRFLASHGFRSERDYRDVFEVGDEADPGAHRMVRSV